MWEELGTKEMQVCWTMTKTKSMSSALNIGRCLLDLLSTYTSSSVTGYGKMSILFSTQTTQLIPPQRLFSFTCNILLRGDGNSTQKVRKYVLFCSCGLLRHPLRHLLSQRNLAKNNNNCNKQQTTTNSRESRHIVCRFQ